MCGYALSDRPPFLRLAGSRTDDRRPHTGQYRLGADFRSGKSEFCAPLRAAAEGPTIIAIYNGSNPLRAQRGALCDRARYLGASFFRPRQSLPVLFGGECPPPRPHQVHILVAENRGKNLFLMAGNKVCAMLASLVQLEELLPKQLTVVCFVFRLFMGNCPLNTAPVQVISLQQNSSR